jgi:hypothetical protein
MILREIKELLADINSPTLSVPQSWNSLAHSIAAAGRLTSDKPDLVMNVLIPGVTVVVASLSASLTS